MIKKTARKKVPVPHPLFQMALINYHNDDANLISVARLLHTFAPRKEKIFCPCIVFFRTQASEFVLPRLREVQAVFLLNKLHRYSEARLFGALKGAIYVCVLVNCCMAFHPSLSKTGLIGVS